VLGKRKVIISLREEDGEGRKKKRGGEKARIATCPRQTPKKEQLNRLFSFGRGRGGREKDREEKRENGWRIPFLTSESEGVSHERT